MESGSYDSPSAQKGDKSSSEESCSECCSCEACRHTYSAEDSTEHLQPTFTKIRQAPRTVVTHSDDQDCLPPEKYVPVSQTASCPGPDTYTLTMAIEDLHARQAQLKTRKQRRCAFCRIHGFPVNLKGHKAFCHFRERCMCTGCTLIRCNQRVSKNQVKLRRLKNLEADLEGLTPGILGRPVAEPANKKPPMCFKCWIHDSVRVRLKGHRTLCPYARCACSNCALNSDRKWLTRQLRQLSAPPKKEGWEGVGASFEIPSTTLQPSSISEGSMSNCVDDFNVDMTLKSAATLSSECQKDDTGLNGNALPFRFPRADDWQLNSGFTSFPAVKQNQPNFLAPSHSHTQAGPVPQETSCPMSGNKWPPPSSLQPPAPHQSFTPANSGLRGYASDMITISSIDYDSMGGVTDSPGRGRGASGSLCRWYPDSSCVSGTEGGGLLMGPARDAAHCPLSAAFSLPPHSLQQHQQPLQMGCKIHLSF